MSTEQKPTLLDKVEGFFGIKKADTTSTSSVERSGSAQAQADAEAAHRAALVSDKGIPQPVPTEVLRDVEKQHGKVPHAHHVDLAKVEHSSVPVGHVMKDPSLLDKMSAAFHDLTTSKSTSTSTSTSASTAVQTSDKIPHSALPNETLKELKAASGHVPNAHHVQTQVHDTAVVGHVVKDATLLDKMGAKIDNLTHPKTTPATTTTTNTPIHTNDKIPHSALPNQVLADVKSHAGKPEHVHHVETQVHDSTVVGHVMKDPSMLDKMSAKIKDMTSSNTATTTTATTNTAIQTNDKIPHSALPNQTLKDIKSHAGKPEHAHHVETQVHDSAVVGHVMKDPSMLDKMSAKIKDITSSNNITTTTTNTAIKTHDNIPHAALPNAVLGDIKKHNGKPEHAHHVDAPKEHSSVPLGHVVAEPTLMDKAECMIDKMGAKLKDLTSSTSTSSTTNSAIHTSDKIPHSALPNSVLRDVKSHHGKPEHVHHVQVQEHSSVPLGRVVGEPSVLDKATAAAIHVTDQAKTAAIHAADEAKTAALQVSDKLTGTSAPVQHATNIPTASLNSAVMKDIRQQHGHVPNATHIQVIEHSAVPLGHVVEKRE